MAATPSNNRLKFTPSNSPFLTRPSRSPMRGRPAHDPKLSLKRVIGTTCSSPTGFDTVNSSFAYIAGGAVVVVDVDGESHTQRFYRARPTAVPLYSVATYQNNPSTPTATPKANDSRNRVAARFRDSPHNPVDWDDSPGGKTWTSRERIKAATCLALSREGKYLAVGETGYAPRVLVFNLQDTSSDIPLVSISEHTFGVKAVAWSADTRYLASLGATNDGFLYVWKIDPRTGAARQFQQNRCTSFIKDMVWMGNCLITLGVRHAKMWKVEEAPTLTSSPTKQRFNSEGSSSTPSYQKTLPGRNIILGSLLDATFSCAAVVNGSDLICCSETGDVCILDDDDRQMRMLKVTNLGFHITSVTIKDKVAYVGGRAGYFATLDVDAVLDCRASCVINSTESSHRVVALGFLTDNLVTIDTKHSIDIWNSDHVPGKDDQALAQVPIPGHGEAITGIQALEKPNELDAAFLTWSSSGNVTFWDLDGRIKSSIDVPIEQMEPESEMNPLNQLTFARTTSSGKLLVAADRLGVLKVEDIATRECLLDTKAHSADIRHVSVFENASTFLMASSGRDRTTQLFHRTVSGSIEHFQTLEFSAKVVQVLIPSEDKVLTCSLDRTLQVHDIVSRDGEPDVLAAVSSRNISLKATPTSMALGPSEKTIFVSMVDRSVCQYDLNTGRQISCFKCLDEGGIETAVLDSLSTGQWLPKDQDFLLGTSNTDKSIRLYDAQTGSFLDREWGHTEAINGVCLVDDDEGGRKVVSVGSDGTIMIWALDLNDPPPSSMSRDPSPVKDGVSGRPPLRRVLSKAEIAEFQRPSSARGRRSPPRTLQRRTSRFNLAASLKTPTAPLPVSPGSSTIMEDTPSRRLSTDSRATSPPMSPKSKVKKRPSLPTLGSTARRKSSSSSLRGFGSLNMATEQTCRTLRAYRKKLSSAEPIDQDVLSELDQELRLTAAALGDRAMRTTTLNEAMLSGLLDQYSERLVTLLDEKLRLTYQPRERDADSPTEEEHRSADGDTSSLSP